LDGKKESKNNPELGKYWASLGDVFVNDAFGTCHRAHASNVGIASNIEKSCIGLLVQNELEMLSKCLNGAKKPFYALIGGAKVSDKIDVITNLLDKADKIFIGGGMAYTFLKAQGHSIGSSLVEDDKIDLAKNIISKSNGKLFLPVDHKLSKEFKNSKPIISQGVNIEDGFMGLDIGPKTIENYKKHISDAKTIIWNGPMGVFEFNEFAKGTLEICKIIASLNGAFSLIGGGDSASAAISLGFSDKFFHISTGGGASLEFLEGKKLPGIESISNI